MEQAEEHIRKQKKKYVCKQAVCIRDTVVGAIKAFVPCYNHICLEKWGTVQFHKRKKELQKGKVKPVWDRPCQITAGIFPSHRMIAEDAEGGLFTVTLFRKVMDDFKAKARENR